MAAAGLLGLNLVHTKETKIGLQYLLSYSQSGPSQNAKQGKEEESRNHLQTFFLNPLLH